MTEFIYSFSDGCPLYATTIESAGKPTGCERLVVVLRCGGGPDHRSLMTLAQQLADCHTVVLPDICGYSHAVCAHP